jgi:hypothetical protein
MIIDNSIKPTQFCLLDGEKEVRLEHYSTYFAAITDVEKNELITVSRYRLSNIDKSKIRLIDLREDSVDIR